MEGTTLKSLGLNSGRAILRLMYRDPEQLKTQAHVSTPLLPKPVVAVNDLSNRKEYQRISESVVPRCSRTTEQDSANSSTTNISSMENRQDLQERVLVDNNREEIIDPMEENHSVACSRDSRRDEGITEMGTETRKEDSYEIKFVRCNCADMCNADFRNPVFAHR